MIYDAMVWPSSHCKCYFLKNSIAEADIKDTPVTGLNVYFKLGHPLTFYFLN